MPMMQMFFNYDYPSNILFKPWSPKTDGELFGACAAIFFIAALFEGLKFFRQLAYTWESRWTIKAGISTVDATSSLAGQSATTTAITPSNSYRTMCRPMHLLQTLLVGMQFVLGYFMMLTAMTFNVYLFVAIILGSMFGYFIFQWYPVAPGYAPLQNDHCH